MAKGDAQKAAGPESIAQQTAVNDDEKKNREPEQAAEGGSPDESGADADVQFFDGTVAKVNAEGKTVMSNHLMPGEKLRREETDRYTRSSADKVGAEDEKKRAEENKK